MSQEIDRQIGTVCSEDRAEAEGEAVNLLLLFSPLTISCG